GQQERVVFNELQGPLQPSAGHRGLPGVYQRNAPILLVVLVVILDLRPGAQAKRDVAGIPVIVAEIFLDDFALIAETEQEVLMPIVGVDVDDVRQDGAVANRHHWLGPEFSFLAQARAQTTAKNHYFHQCSDSNSCTTRSRPELTTQLNNRFHTVR